MDRRALLQGTGLSSFLLAVDARRFFSGDGTTARAAPGADHSAETHGAPEAPGATSATTRRYVDEPHMRRVEHVVDVLVVGGGMSGVCAALAAARNGARTMLVQDRSRLGGNASSEVRMHIVGADSHGARAGWREGGLIEEIRLEDAVRNPHRAWELFDLTLYDLCLREPSLTLLLDSALFGADTEDGRIVRAHVRCDKTETLHHITAKSFIDATGDGRLALESGAAFREGREARATYGEPLAMVEGDDRSQGCSILFTARKHARAMPFSAPPWARKLTENDLLFRKPGQGSYEYGYWWIELGGEHDVIRDNELLRFELLRVVMGVWDWIKNSGERPDSANWALETVGMIPGKRESRRLTGAHVLTQQDLEGGWKERDDGVSIGGWNFDEHPPGGFDAWNEPPYYSRPVPEPYNIAFEALYSGNVANLLMAGRNISCSHVAFTSTRVMATCACTGQAVGTAAALCVAHDVTPATLRAKHMRELQQRLLRDDQTIRGVANADPLDLARRARASASHHLEDAPPSHVLNGHVRDAPGQWGARWGATVLDADGNAAAWLDLEWSDPVPLSRVQLTFDSGFHRELTLSASDSITKKMVRGPQPETVRDYRLIAITPSGEVVVAEVFGNYQRLRRHTFPRLEVTRLRLHVTATNGADTVRVFEVRCYEA
ncbi:MAG: FAD-dependent oxidoreductase [Planctomycetota bacterium]